MLMRAVFCFFFAVSVAGVADDNVRGQPKFVIGIPDILRDAIPRSTLSSTFVTVQAAYQSIGKEVELFHAPAKRLAFMTGRNALDAEFIRTSYYGDQHNNMLKVPVPLFSGGIYAVSLAKNAVDIDRIKLKELVLGCLRGVLMTDAYCEQGRSRIDASSIEQLIQLLEQERIQVMVVFSGVIHEPILNNKMFLIHESPLRQFSGYHFINQKHKDILPALTEALKQELSKAN